MLDPVDVLPQAGQGAIAVQCRADDDGDPATCSAAIDHEPSHRAAAGRARRPGRARRELHGAGRRLRRAGRGTGTGAARVAGSLASGDGHTVIRLTRRGDDPEAVGAEVARALLDGGGAAIEGFGGLRGRRTVTVYLVGAGPGDPGLLTRRGAALLARADVVLHDRLVSPRRPRPGARHRRSCSTWARTRTRRRAGRGARRRSPACSSSTDGRSAVVVRLKGGDPFLFGRGGEEVEALAQAGIDWEVVPGVTSAFGVPAAAGIPVTQRGLAASVTVVTGRVGEPDGTGEPRLGGAGPGRRDPGRSSWA